MYLIRGILVYSLNQYSLVERSQSLHFSIYMDLTFKGIIYVWRIKLFTLKFIDTL